MTSDQKFLDDFPPISREAWEDLIKKDLRGADYKTRLKWHTDEGIDVLPFYREDDLPAEAPSAPAGTPDWDICQSITEQNIKAANETARRALQNGADALSFQINLRRREDDLGSELRGLPVQDQEDFTTLTDGIDLTQTPLHFDSGPASPLMLAMLHNEVERQNLDHAKVKGSLLYDPYACFLTEGRLPKADQSFIQEAKQLVDFCDAELPAMKCLGVDARVYHRAGSTIVQQLGYALATGSEYLAKLSDAGLETDEIASAVHFNFPVGSNYFLEMAKFRAARKLWRNILDAYEVDANQEMYLHGTSSGWNKTQYDPYVNMLRTTTEGMSAAVAGCDAITLQPFDATFRQPNDFSRRIARNTQIILKEEAYFNKVADPAAGSYYIEMLTDKIARAAWACFQEVERQGGFYKAIQNGHVQLTIEESRDSKDDAIATRGRIFVGINQYPNTTDTPADENPAEDVTVSLRETGQQPDLKSGRLMSSLKEAFKDSAALGDVTSALFTPKGEKIQPIHPYRGAQAFERLRQATENYGTTPQVLTLPLGDKKMRKARSAFAVNFFGCAGYNITDPIGFDSVEDAVAEIKNQQPDIVVLCSSDEAYEELVPKLCNQLKDLSQRPITVLAGYPKENIESYKKTGIDLFIHSKSNVLETLEDFQQRLGVT